MKMNLRLQTSAFWNGRSLWPRPPTVGLARFFHLYSGLLAATPGSELRASLPSHRGGPSAVVQHPPSGSGWSTAACLLVSSTGKADGTCPFFSPVLALGVDRADDVGLDDGYDAKLLLSEVDVMPIPIKQTAKPMCATLMPTKDLVTFCFFLDRSTIE